MSHNLVKADTITRYSDVTHEVAEVTSGYRWVLTYNLVHKRQGEKPSAARARSDLRELRAAFKSWQKDEDLLGQDHLIHILQHQYTDASLRLNALKPVDMVAARALQEVSNETDCTLFLASCEREVYGACEDEYEDHDEHYGYGCGYDEEDEDEDENETELWPEFSSRVTRSFHPISEVCDEKLLFKRVVDLDGITVAKHFLIDEEDFLADSPFEDRDPDDEDYSGFTGNEGVSATHWYRDSVGNCISSVKSFPSMSTKFVRLL
jgi:hypothetical protein